LFEAPARGKPLEYRDEIWQQKTGIARLPDNKEIMTLAFFVLTQYRRVPDRQTDGQTRCCRKDPRQHSVARVKNNINESAFLRYLHRRRQYVFFSPH